MKHFILAAAVALITASCGDGAGNSSGSDSTGTNTGTGTESGVDTSISGTGNISPSVSDTSNTRSLDTMKTGSNDTSRQQR